MSGSTVPAPTGPTHRGAVADVINRSLAFAALGIEEHVREQWPGGEHDGVAPPGLTRRQLEVVELLGMGLTVQAIAHRLNLSPRTVGKHLERVYRRLGTSDRLMTVMRAHHYGLLREPPPQLSRTHLARS